MKNIDTPRCITGRAPFVVFEVGLSDGVFDSDVFSKVKVPNLFMELLLWKEPDCVLSKKEYGL